MQEIDQGSEKIKAVSIDPNTEESVKLPITLIHWNESLVDTLSVSVFRKGGLIQTTKVFLNGKELTSDDQFSKNHNRFYRVVKNI